MDLEIGRQGGKAPNLQWPCEIQESVAGLGEYCASETTKIYIFSEDQKSLDDSLRQETQSQP